MGNVKLVGGNLRGDGASLHVVAFAKHTEKDKEFVVARELYGEYRLIMCEVGKEDKLFNVGKLEEDFDTGRDLRPGDVVNHFKNKKYVIVGFATEVETGEAFVIYTALYGDTSTYARPFKMFMSEVDREKHPEATQKYRMELFRR